jgi:hypothetical protein
MKIMMLDLMEHKERILEKIDLLVPDIRWDGSRRRSEVIGEHSREEV